MYCSPMLGFYEFFAGGGMVRAGLGPNWQCLFANDFDAKKCRTYVENWGDDHLHRGDIAGVSAHDLPSRADLAWASFPCQDLSLAGMGQGLDGARSGSFWAFWRLMSDLSADGRKPKTIILENVRGLLTSNNGQDFETIIRALIVERYVVGALVVDAAAYVPQSRSRLFIMAFDHQLEPSFSQISSVQAVDPKLRAIVAGLPSFLQEQWRWFSLPEPPKRSITLDSLLMNGSAVQWDTNAKTEQYLAMMSPTNLSKIERARQSTKREIGTLYKRTRMEGRRKVQRAEVRFDGIAGCLRTPGGGSSRQTLVVVEGGCVRTRLLHGREAARLMGLPDEYCIPTNRNEAYYLAGDGVAVPVVAALAKYILEPVLKPEPALHV